MSYIKRKLKSNSGATLMVALLFFVVCAVTGSMILLSATVASGRVKDMRENDQNYYAVRSATKFLEKKLTEDYIRVEETLTIEEETVTTTDEEGNEKEITRTYYTYSGPVIKHVKDDGHGGETTADISSGSDGDILYHLLTSNEITNIEEKDPVSRSESYPEGFNKKWFKDIDDPNEAGVTSEGAKLSVKKGGSEGDSLKDLDVDVKMNLCSSGILTVTVTNTDTEDKKNKYSMILKMQCDKSRSTVGDDVKKRTYNFKFKTLSIEKA